MPFRRRHRLYGPFALYGGRVEPDNGCEEMLEYFDSYAAADGDAALVLMGVKMMKVPDEPYLRLAGVLPDRERMIAYEAADVTIAPASDDLLAQPLLESLAVGTPVLASARNAAAVEHCRRANAGLYYANRDEFVEALRLLMTNTRLRERLGENGRALRPAALPLGRACSAASSGWSRESERRSVAIRATPASARRRETDARTSASSSRLVGAAPSCRRVPISYRLIISFSVVGLICSSSAARFCTPPAASSVDSISRFSTLVMTSLNEMPFGRHDELRDVERRRRAHVVGNQLGADARCRAQHHRALDHVLELAHVARPVVLHQQVERVRRRARCPACCSPRRTSRGSAAPAAGCRPCARAAAAGGC